MRGVQRYYVHLEGPLLDSLVRTHMFYMYALEVA